MRRDWTCYYLATMFALCALGFIGIGIVSLLTAIAQPGGIVGWVVGLPLLTAFSILAAFCAWLVASAWSER